MIWRILKTIKIQELWGLSILCVKHPKYIRPTFKGSRRCIEICDALYGKTHHRHNVANAFRHALWNMLIAHNCHHKTKDVDRVLAWAKLITDWHEDFSVNEPLERAMDLHNNAIGRNRFTSLFAQKEVKIVDFLQKITKNAKKVTNIEEIDQYKDQLVYLEE